MPKDVKYHLIILSALRGEKPHSVKVFSGLGAGRHSKDRSSGI